MTNFTAAFLGYRNEWEIERIRDRVPDGVEVVGTPLEPVETAQERGEPLAREAEVIIPWRFSVSPEHARLPRLKLVQALSAGTDRFPKKELHEAGVMVAGNQGANSVAVSEHAILLMLAVNRQLVRQHTSVAAGRWRGNETPRGFVKVTATDR